MSRQLADTFASAHRLKAVHDEPVLVTDGPGTQAPPSSRGSAIQLDNVGFTYPGAQRPALSGISLDIEPGSTVALVGHSGSGKTTLANLLLRFWDPPEGVIRLDGHDLREYKLDALRSRIALVAQDTYLFNDTLRANVALARPGASASDIAQAIERAALGEFVARLPEQLETRVGERGVQLSGGQRQRVAIARAFLKNAPVLILDEATSHLDAISEARVRQALVALMHNRTTLVIAHRLFNGAGGRPDRRAQRRPAGRDRNPCEPARTRRPLCRARRTATLARSGCGVAPASRRPINSGLLPCYGRPPQLVKSG